MTSLLISVLLGAILLFAIGLQKSYKDTSQKELKRQAKAGDELANLLYRAVGYGASLDILLWLIIGITAGGFFVYVSRHFPAIIAWFGSVAVIWFGFAWMPHAPVTHTGRRLTKAVTPAVQWLLDKLHPILQKLTVFINKHRPITVRTGLYAKEDLIDLIDQQKVQINNRITKEELRIAKHALTFGDKTIGQVMTPRRQIKMVSADEPVGPILLDELHKSGFSRFPVYKDKPDNIIGTLYLRTISSAKAGGRVEGIMSKHVYYVNETLSLNRVLDAFIKTHAHLFIVVNNFEEVSGVISLEDVLEEIIGKLIVDEFDHYDDLRAVAAETAGKVAKENSTITEQTNIDSLKTVKKPHESSPEVVK